MIDINLLPEGLRKKRRLAQIEILHLPKEVIIGFVGALVGLLFIIHLVLFLFTIANKMSLSGLSRQWDKIQPQKKEADTLKQEISAIESRIRTLTSLKAHKTISWSEKLNRISDSMVRGLWLTRVYFGEGLLKIEGSAVSQKGEEMINVGKFTSNLKGDKKFYADLRNIELTSIERKNIKAIEVVDFVITTSVKE